MKRAKEEYAWVGSVRSVDLQREIFLVTIYHSTFHSTAIYVVARRLRRPIVIYNRHDLRRQPRSGLFLARGTSPRATSLAV